MQRRPRAHRARPRSASTDRVAHSVATRQSNGWACCDSPRAFAVPVPQKSAKLAYHGCASPAGRAVPPRPDDCAICHTALSANPAPSDPEPRDSARPPHAGHPRPVTPRSAALRPAAIAPQLRPPASAARARHSAGGRPAGQDIAQNTVPRRASPPERAARRPQAAPRRHHNPTVAATLPRQWHPAIPTA